MINVRKGVFETNSSSTHAICVFNKDTFNKIDNGELFFDAFGKTYTLDDVKEKIANTRKYDEYFDKWYNIYYSDNIYINGTVEITSNKYFADILRMLNLYSTMYGYYADIITKDIEDNVIVSLYRSE